MPSGKRVPTSKWDEKRLRGQMKRSWPHCLSTQTHFKNKMKKRKRTSKNLLRSIHTALNRGRGQRRHRCLAHAPSHQSLSRSRNVPAFRRASAPATSTASWLRIRKRAKAKDISNPASTCINRRPTRNGKKFTIRLTIPVSLGIVALCDNLNGKMRGLPLPTP